MTSDDEKMRIDEEWKIRAEEEKRKIEAAFAPTPEPAPPVEGEASPAETSGETGSPPPADEEPVEEGRISFLSLLSQLGTQAMAGLGQFPDPRTGQRHVDLELARDTLDLLAVLERKTRGNLTDEEKLTLTEMLHQLRAAYVQIQRAAQEQIMNTPPPGSGGEPGPR